MVRIRLLSVSGAIATFVVATAAGAAAPAGMEAGEWHRSTLLNIKNPVLSNTNPMLARMFTTPIQSDVCISEDLAQRGPLAIVLMEEDADCQVTHTEIHGDQFAAKRVCRLQSGKQAVYDLLGRFTSSTITLDQVIEGDHGPDATPHSEFHRTGPCRPDAAIR